MAGERLDDVVAEVIDTGCMDSMYTGSDAAEQGASLHSLGLARRRSRLGFMTYSPLPRLLDHGQHDDRPRCHHV